MKDKHSDKINLGLTPPLNNIIIHYRKLLLDSRFSSWSEPSETKIERYCEIQGSVTHLGRQGKMDKHIKNVNSENKSGKLTDFLQPATSVHITNIAAPEPKLCSLIAEHNLPVRLMNHLPGLIQTACPYSKMVKGIKCARTKATQIYKNVLGPYYFENLIKQLKECKFSLIVDETTDVSTKKQLVLLARFYDCSTQKIIDSYLILLKAKDCSANGIFSSIKRFFTLYDIPFENLIGFASDLCLSLYAYLCIKGMFKITFIFRRDC
ncbi:uncharacterized protein LOC106876603 [Octopus bimaculoides]|nr:uncharacterized protein LOC106876603 [Octopus bimaculoides]|eukprot:XP_014780700.1 PREDICTED: uncharacterized protein LOC106876603 [Octopus bimaculoides]